MKHQTSILKAIAYFDVFSYPLSFQDILFYLDTEIGASELEEELDHLLKEGQIFKTGIFYSLRNDITLAHKRLHGEEHARELLSIAYRNSRFLYQFPFVRGVFISGSLSKNCAGPDADIDYFILTSPNRLYIARTLLHLYKKLTYLRGRQHRYCMNYFIDEKDAEIKEKNNFTATELLTLIPAAGGRSITRFFRTNSWATGFYPQYRRRSLTSRIQVRDSFVKRLLERIFNNRWVDRLDNFFYKLTQSRWQAKEAEGQKNIKGERMALLCTKHSARPNPGLFQQRILELLDQKLEGLLFTSYAGKECSNPR